MPAYAIGIDFEIIDQREFERYLSPAMASLEQYGGRFIVRSENAELLDGEPGPKMVVMAEFPSIEIARRWYHSKEYQAVLPIRLASTRGRVFLVDGLS